MPYDATPASEWLEYSSITTWGKYSKTEITSFTYLQQVYGVGRIFTDHDNAVGPSDVYTHAFYRGGYFGSGAFGGGLFNLVLYDSPLNMSAGISFRCAR